MAPLKLSDDSATNTPGTTNERMGTYLYLTAPLDSTASFFLTHRRAKARFPATNTIHPREKEGQSHNRSAKLEMAAPNLPLQVGWIPVIMAPHGFHENIATPL